MKVETFYSKHGKRFLDVIFSLTLLVFFSPFLIVLSILIFIFLGFPIIFKQERPGLNEKIFVLYKFRTMSSKKDDEGNLLPDNFRLTKFGLFLRSTSLDELPELLNILKGDMSFVGPRPLLCEYLPFYNDNQKKRHEVLPGLTGLAQINGRNKLSWSEKFNLDIEYIYNFSFKMDLSIFFKTFKMVFMRHGINSKEGKIVEKFNGRN